MNPEEMFAALFGRAEAEEEVPEVGVEAKEPWLEAQEGCVSELMGKIADLLEAEGEDFFAEARRLAFEIQARIPPVVRPAAALAAAGREVRELADPAYELRVIAEDIRDAVRDLLGDIRTQKALYDSPDRLLATPMAEFADQVVERLVELASWVCWLRAAVYQREQMKREYMRHRETMHEGEAAPWGPQMPRRER